MFTRFAASCASALLILATVHAQQTPPPGQEGPPSVEFPRPRVEGGPPPRQDGPPPRVEGAPPSQDAPPPRVEGGPPSRDDPPPRADTPPPREQDDPPPRADTPPPRDDRPPARADRADLSERCGAVAYTADGAFGAAYGMEDCADAERLAVEECRRESTDKADCSRGVITRRDNWFHIQFCKRGNDWTTHITTRRTLSEVNRAASEWAQSSQYGPQNCRMVPNGLLHSAGLHTKM